MAVFHVDQGTGQSYLNVREQGQGHLKGPVVFSAGARFWEDGWMDPCFSTFPVCRLLALCYTFHQSHTVLLCLKSFLSQR